MNYIIIGLVIILFIQMNKERKVRNNNIERFADVSTGNVVISSTQLEAVSNAITAMKALYGSDALNLNNLTLNTATLRLNDTLIDSIKQLFNNTTTGSNIASRFILDFNPNTAVTANTHEPAFKFSNTLNFQTIDKDSAAVIATPMVIHSGGNVGIGITNPLAPLSFGEKLGPKINLYSNTYSIGIESSELRYATNGFHAWRTGGYSGTEAMRILANGNVGIGITNPSSNLEIVGSGGAGVLRITNKTDGAETGIGFYRNANKAGTTAGDIWVMGHNSWQPGDRNFGIGCSGKGLILKLESNGNATINGNTYSINGNRAVELCTEANNLAYIDFNSQNDRKTDYDARISVAGGTDKVGAGVLNITSANFETRIQSDIDSLVRIGGTNIFQNNATRTTDGGANTTTIRNDRGTLRLQGRGSGGVLVDNNLNVANDLILRNPDSGFIIHNPPGDRKILAFAPWLSTSSTGDWDWGRQMTLFSNGNLSVAGDLTVAGTITRFGRQFDNRAAKPTDFSTGTFAVGFGSYNNNSTTSWSDNLVLNTWSDRSGGNTNMIAFNKATFGIRQYQGIHSQTTVFTSYKDVLFQENNGDVNISGVINTPSGFQICELKYRQSLYTFPTGYDKTRYSNGGRGDFGPYYYDIPADFSAANFPADKWNGYIVDINLNNFVTDWGQTVTIDNTTLEFRDNKWVIKMTVDNQNCSGIHKDCDPRLIVRFYFVEKPLNRDSAIQIYRSQQAANNNFPSDFAFALVARNPKNNIYTLLSY